MRLFRDNGLAIVLVLTSVLTIGGMLATGWAVYNEELAQHHAMPLTFFPMQRAVIFSPLCSKTGRANSSRCRLT